MISIAYCGIATYLLFAFLGFGAYILLVSRRGIRPTTLFVLPPFFGCAGVVLALTHCLSWRLDIPQVSLVILAVMGLPSLAALAVARRELAITLRRAMRSPRWMAWASTALLIGLLLLWSATRDGRLNSPYRLGIDQVGYITTAAVLNEGATLDTIEAGLLADTRARDRAGAMRKIESAVDYTNQVSAVFLFGAVRWGVSLLLVFLTTVLRLPHVAIAVYPLIALSLVLLHGLVFLFCRRQFRSAGFAPCLAIASSVSLNSNMLNVAFDGQLGQEFCLPYFFAWWWQCVKGFSTLPDLGLPHPRSVRRREWTRWAIAIMAVVAILPSYGEFVILLVILTALSLAADAALQFVRRQSHVLRPYRFPIVSLTISLLLLGGFGVQWLHNVAFTRFGDIRLAGWMQPRWATPIDILGYDDMYTSLVHELVRQSYRDVEFQFVANAVVVAVIALGIMRNSDAWRACWVVLPMFVAVVYVKTRFIENIHNYQYMKSYTMLGPILFLLYAGCLLRALGLERKSTTVWKRFGVPDGGRRILAAVVLLCPVSVGAESLRRFHERGHFLSLDDLALQGSEPARALLSRHVIVTPGTTAYSIGHDSLAFHFRFHWLRDRHPQELAPYREWPVAIYLDGDTSPRMHDLLENGPVAVLRTDRFVVLDSGLQVSDVLTADGRDIDWSRLAAVVQEMIGKDPS
jgi:hypothetical protein